jgi:V/A-type H+-transporting ATPase subunit E
MDIQLQELIDKIKKDGIEKASIDAARAKAEGEAEARRIVEAAKKEADGILARAKIDAERFEKAGAAALQQASRNLVLAFKAEIDELLGKVIARETAAAYADDALKAAVPEILKAWSAKGSDSLDLLLPPEALSRLEAFFAEKLKSELKAGVVLKGERSVGAGFKIAAKDGSAYYDFSAESVADLLSAYLNPRLAEILKSASKGN